MARTRFRDRAEAGDVLAGLLGHYAGRDDVLVLALPRGGVPVAARVARALGVPLDVFVVRKLGVPGHEELAMGAIASGGVQVVNEQVVGRLGLGEADLRRAAEYEGRELARRERSYREGRPPPDLTGRVVILVDDGLATGSTMRAAVAAARRLGPARVVVAVPTAPPSTCQRLRERGRRGGLRHHPAPVQGGRLLLPVVSPDLRRGGQGPPPGRLGGRPRPRPKGPAGPGPGEPNLDRSS